MLEKKKPSVLFICLGNYCRSPVAEGIFRHLAQQNAQTKDIHIESCGLTDSFLGCLPDSRMQEIAKARGIDLVSRGKLFQIEYFDRFDYILPVTAQIMKFLDPYAKTAEHKKKLMLMTAFSTKWKGQDIPDPYYHDDQAFEDVYNMIEDCCETLLNEIIQKMC